MSGRTPSVAPTTSSQMVAHACSARTPKRPASSRSRTGTRSPGPRPAASRNASASRSASSRVGSGRAKWNAVKASPAARACSFTEEYRSSTREAPSVARAMTKRTPESAAALHGIGWLCEEMSTPASRTVGGGGDVGEPPRPRSTTTPTRTTRETMPAPSRSAIRAVLRMALRPYRGGERSALDPGRSLALQAQAVLRGPRGQPGVFQPLPDLRLGALAEVVGLIGPRSSQDQQNQGLARIVPVHDRRGSEPSGVPTDRLLERHLLLCRYRAPELHLALDVVGNHAPI